MVFHLVKAAKTVINRLVTSQELHHEISIGFCVHVQTFAVRHPAGKSMFTGAAFSAKRQGKQESMYRQPPGEFRTSDISRHWSSSPVMMVVICGEIPKVMGHVDAP